jgi:hypothetical protein
MKPANTSQTEARAAPSTAWRPGQSGNPAGRPRKTQELRDLEAACRAKAPDALRVLTALMQKADKDSTRLAAALAILDRGFGKPVSREEHGTPGDFARNNRTPSEIMADIREKAAKLGIRGLEFGKEWKDGK